MRCGLGKHERYCLGAKQPQNQEISSTAIKGTGQQEETGHNDGKGEGSQPPNKISSPMLSHILSQPHEKFRSYLATNVREPPLAKCKCCLENVIASELKMHQQKCEQELSECKSCGLWCRKGSGLANHESSCLENALSQSQKNSKPLADTKDKLIHLASELKMHQEKCEQEFQECKYCGMPCKRGRGLAHHERSCLKNKQKTGQCKFCGSWWGTSFLKRHEHSCEKMKQKLIKGKRPAAKDTSATNHKRYCLKNKQSKFHERSSMVKVKTAKKNASTPKNHASITPSGGKSTTKCKLCLKWLSGADLQQHEIMCKQKLTVPCKFCKQWFSRDVDLSEFRGHEELCKKQLKEKGQTCQYCGKGFMSDKSSELKLHEQSCKRNGMRMWKVGKWVVPREFQMHGKLCTKQQMDGRIKKKVNKKPRMDGSEHSLKATYQCPTCSQWFDEKMFQSHWLEGMCRERSNNPNISTQIVKCGHCSHFIVESDLKGHETICPGNRDVHEYSLPQSGANASEIAGACNISDEISPPIAQSNSFEVGTDWCMAIKAETESDNCSRERYVADVKVETGAEIKTENMAGIKMETGSVIKAEYKAEVNPSSDTPQVCMDQFMHDMKTKMEFHERSSMVKVKPAKKNASTPKNHASITPSGGKSTTKCKLCLKWLSGADLQQHEIMCKQKLTVPCKFCKQWFSRDVDLSEFRGHEELCKKQLKEKGQTCQYCGKGYMSDKSSELKAHEQSCKRNGGKWVNPSEFKIHENVCTKQQMYGGIIKSVVIKPRIDGSEHSLKTTYQCDTCSQWFDEKTFHLSHWHEGMCRQRGNNSIMPTLIVKCKHCSYFIVGSDLKSHETLCPGNRNALEYSTTESHANALEMLHACTTSDEISQTMAPSNSFEVGTEWHMANIKTETESDNCSREWYVADVKVEAGAEIKTEVSTRSDTPEVCMDRFMPDIKTKIEFPEIYKDGNIIVIQPETEADNPLQYRDQYTANNPLQCRDQFTGDIPLHCRDQVTPEMKPATDIKSILDLNSDVSTSEPIGWYYNVTDAKETSVSVKYEKHEQNMLVDTKTELEQNHDEGDFRKSKELGARYPMVNLIDISKVKKFQWERGKHVNEGDTSEINRNREGHMVHVEKCAPCERWIIGEDVMEMHRSKHL